MTTRKTRAQRRTHRASNAPRSATRKAPRRATGGDRALAARIAALEDRVARLETGKPPPGDGRAAVPRRKAVRRCPGCGLPLRARQGRCAGCGRPLD